MRPAPTTPKRRLAILAGLAPLLLFQPGRWPPTSPTFACGWREPPRIYPEGARWTCTAAGWTDGDTLIARCDGEAGTVAVRLRGVDTDEHGEGRWRQARGVAPQDRRPAAGCAAAPPQPPTRGRRRAGGRGERGRGDGRGRVVQGGLPEAIARRGRRERLGLSGRPHSPPRLTGECPRARCGQPRSPCSPLGGCARLRAAPRPASGRGFGLRCARRRCRGQGRGGGTAVLF